ncbi:TonB-dependent receptor [Sphingobium sp.]|uniref:TonB-dependent receptor n=1 Tax=Sphingobium sp. TaxID=1912891 RepID=UPI002CEFF170|nr:TonB-dependent receptor [Sphingobium sp.]HUD94838.1 TonB-dependent receptor [Sphingobium sp.]
MLSSAIVILPLCPLAAKSGLELRYEIQPQALTSAIQQLGLQGHRQILFSASIIKGSLRRPVSGRMSFDRALRQILKGTGLVFETTDTGVVTILRDASRMNISPLEVERATDNLDPLVVTADRRRDHVSFASDFRSRPQEPSIATVANMSVGISSEPAGSGQQALLVRGVGMAGEATTIVYFAGVPVSGPSGTGSDAARTASDLALVDIGRIEISRTGRSSEHGTGSLAGEIEIEPEAANPQQLQAVSAARLSFQQGGEPGVALSSTLNVPVGANTALRATAYVNREGGYIDNVRTGVRNINDDDIAGFRLVARTVPTPDLDMSLLLAWQHRGVNDTSAWFRSLGSYRTDRYFAAPTSHDFLLGRITLQYDMGDLRLTSMSAAYRWKLDRRYDRSYATLLQGRDLEGCQRYFDLATPSCDAGQSEEFADYVEGLTPSLLHIPIVSTRVVQEVRLSRDAPFGLTWVAGLLLDYRSERLRSELSSLPDEYESGSVLFGARKLAITRKQAGIFGTLAYKDADGLLVSAGLRYDNHHVSSQNDVVVPNILSGSIASWPLTAKASQGISGRIHVDVPIVSGATWHTQLARSFRPAGVNTASVLLPDRLTFGRDSLWGVEMGLNLRWSRWAEMTLVTYFNDWRNMQYRALSENRSHAYLVNIGNAMIRGAEVEIVVRPAANFVAKVEASLIHARMARVTEAQALVGGAEVGDDIPFVPDRRMQVSLARSWNIRSGSQIKMTGDWQYQSGSWSTFNGNDPDFAETSGFSLFGASLSYRWNGGDISLQARNIFDRVANLRTVTNGYGVGQTFSYGPRTIMLSWNRRW